MIKIIIDNSASHSKVYKGFRIEGLHDKYNIGDLVSIVDGDQIEVAVLAKREVMCATEEACLNCMFKNSVGLCGYTNKDGWFPCVAFGREVNGYWVVFVPITKMLEDL